MTNTPEQTRYIEALCQIETGIQYNGQLYLPFGDLVAMIRNMPQDDIQIDCNLWRETADDWRQDALRYREALKDIRRNLGCSLPDDPPGVVDTIDIVNKALDGKMPIDYQKLTEASLRLKITDLERARRYELDQLSYAIDLLDECLDLHTDPKDSDLHDRIRMFIDGPINPVAQDAQPTNRGNNEI